MSKKELLFSVTAKDCRWDFFVGQGNGGQNKQKTNSACRCTHIASGAVGVSQEERSQELNKRKAFKKMAETKEFKLWIKVQTARLNGEEADIEKTVNAAMNKKNIRVEGKNDKGLWEKIEDEN